MPEGDQMIVRVDDASMPQAMERILLVAGK
jgi:hypothetical protein